MRRKTRKFALILLSALSLSLLSSTHLSLQPVTNAQGTMDAATLFDKNCARCHGKDGRAKTHRGKIYGARNLTDPDWQAQATDERIMGAIKKGPEAMPSFEKKLSESEIASLVAYVRSLKGAVQKPKKN
jgi:mono/diheme cytochrome c family protein